MKLRVISELFDRLSLDDVSFSMDGKNYSYEFSSNGMDYEVVFDYENDMSSSFGDSYDDEYDESDYVLISDIPYIETLSKLKVGNVYSIELRANQSPTATGMNNPQIVYSKMLACILDFLTREAKSSRSLPILRFSGLEGDMDVIYDRLLQRMNRQYPKFSYSPYVDEVYIPNTTLLAISKKYNRLYNDMVEIVKNGSDEYYKQLKLRKKSKNSSRRNFQTQ